MITFKCKMCGGDLHPAEDATTCECEYCGSVQTIPTADNEKKMNLFARAQRLLRSCEFDKAAAVYESIVAEFPEEAEAYWGLVLCKYGIEYVDDPATGKKVPTCHRSSFDSVMDDANFEQATENADVIARRVYRDEAKAIEELRKGIIEVSGKEEPYDIFICYKETGENGDRTLDSVLAQDIYDALTEKGYRVFFSRITLEDKLGQEYEPYIFAALNSAKVMLAIGTDYEYYNAVWVKNEWSRFLKLIAAGEKKTLIPCFKGIDAYDMPKEFARLQAQDLGKIGAMQDLLRGIEKILPQKQNFGISQQSIPSNPQIIPLLGRIDIFLTDGEWERVEEYCEKVLDLDPQNAKAYLGKLLAQYRIHDINEITQKFELDITENPLYDKAIRFSDDTLRRQIESAVNARIEGIEKAKRSALTAPGNIITFGKYHKQSGSDMSPIEWIVLDYNDGRTTLISRYVIEEEWYDEDESSETWKESPIRKWLNTSFYDEIFSSAEKQAIIIANNDYLNGSQDRVNDKVFLPSSSELIKYMNNRFSCLATEYVYGQQGQWGTKRGETFDYWLRSNDEPNYAEYIYKNSLAGDVMSCKLGVRPMIIVDSNKANELATFIGKVAE